ncbi:hypothetical protein [Acerihabitans sp.]|uniref:hypothetical protein n=1 Tax=Acerihabitans sp. TaxID=2811394 RepID=UPI002EDAC81D
MTHNFSAHRYNTNALPARAFEHRILKNYARANFLEENGFNFRIYDPITGDIIENELVLIRANGSAYLSPGYIPAYTSYYHYGQNVFLISPIAGSVKLTVRLAGRSDVGLNLAFTFTDATS